MLHIHTQMLNCISFTLSLGDAIEIPMQHTKIHVEKSKAMAENKITNKRVR